MNATQAIWEALRSLLAFARNMSARTISIPAAHILCTETHPRVQSDTENILLPDTTTTSASCTRPKGKGSLTSSTSANSSSSTTQDIHPRHHLAIRSSPHLTISCHRLKDSTLRKLESYFVDVLHQFSQNMVVILWEEFYSKVTWRTR